VEHVVERTSQVADNLRRGLDVKSPEERVAGAQAETDRLAALMEERNTMSPAEMTQAQVGGEASGVMWACLGGMHGWMAAVSSVLPLWLAPLWCCTP
jgi:hypothetical protein